ncbi:hypothetical protein EXU85_03740 [Spirosoma sp. KCTC 42546]|uniref:hypothetical protein n=1 Tax=Spirosoma sp. KCTC 42546 TaxID=2520506 RepID=UPI00115AE627|nr:hypothetical protein [Spirosoma sp. KCTC 42546]QDK77754.1 hypothetical protein EXU85_03740 [Spirosoma sp. KCTC 42546]
MNFYPIRISTLLLFLLFSSCNPSFLTKKSLLTVKRIESIPTETKNSEGGLYYTLPMTVISVEIPVMRIVRDKGDNCWEEALKERLGTKDATELQSKWAANGDSYTFYKIKDEEIKITTRPVPDPSKVFYIELKNKWNKNRELTATLNELGQMTQSDMVNQDKTFDLVVQGVQSVAGIISTLILPKSANEQTGANLADPDTDDLTSFQKRKSDLKAVRAARTALIQQDDNAGSEGIFKRKLEELDKMEEALLSHLTFDETKTQLILRMDILLNKPAANTDPTETINLFSLAKDGTPVLHASPDAGTYQNDYLRDFVTFAAQPDTAAQKVYKLVVSHTFKKQMADYISESTSASLDNRGLSYNVPVWARTKVTLDGKKDGKTIPQKTVAVATVVMPQWGKLAFLPEKSSSTGVEYDLNTGGIRKLSIKQPGLSASQIANAGNALNSAATLVQPASLTAPVANATRDNDLIEQKIRAIKLQMQYDSLSKVKDKLTPVSNN